mgnify:CR=1 FL=1
MYLFVLLLLPKLLFSLELNLLCTNDYPNNKEVDVKDVFLLLDSDSKKIELGGLSFYADEISVTKSNILWEADNIEIYPNSTGEISGKLGRFSGDLVLNFQRHDENKIKSLVFSCRKFELKQRRF